MNLLLNILKGLQTGCYQAEFFRVLKESCYKHSAENPIFILWCTWATKYPRTPL